MSTENIISLLETIKSQIDSSDKHELKAKSLTVSSTLERIFGKSSPYFGKLHGVQKELNMLISLGEHKSSFGYNLEDTQANFHRLIDAVLLEIKTIGFPSTKTSTDKSINISNVLNQDQKVSVNIDLIVNLLKDHLTGNQFKELEKVAEEEKDPEKAKKSVIEKLKSFGENVLSDILANVITTPSIWSGLFS